MTHSVEDYAQWRDVYDGDVARRDQLGLREVGVYREADHPNDILLVYDFDGSNSEAVTTFANSMADPGLQAAMNSSGVKAPPEVWIFD